MPQLKPPPADLLSNNGKTAAVESAPSDLPSNNGRNGNAAVKSSPADLLSNNGKTAAVEAPPADLLSNNGRNAAVESAPANLLSNNGKNAAVEAAPADSPSNNGRNAAVEAHPLLYPRRHISVCIKSPSVHYLPIVKLPPFTRRASRCVRSALPTCSITYGMQPSLTQRLAAETSISLALEAKRMGQAGTPAPIVSGRQRRYYRHSGGVEHVFSIAIC